MKRLASGKWLVSVLLLAAPLSVEAASSTASATVSAQLIARASLALKKDDNSVTRFSASQVVFDRYDDQDPGVTNPNAGFMYAPYRSEVGQNWHVADIIANGSSMTLTASVTGSVGNTPLATLLKVWCGGFFPPGSTTPISGTASTTWESLNSFSRTLQQTFIGTTPFNYQLNVSSAGAGTYSGNVTFTLTSN